MGQNEGREKEETEIGLHVNKGLDFEQTEKKHEIAKNITALKNCPDNGVPFQGTFLWKKLRKRKTLGNSIKIDMWECVCGKKQCTWGPISTIAIPPPPSIHHCQTFLLSPSPFSAPYIPFPPISLIYRNRPSLRQGTDSQEERRPIPSLPLLASKYFDNDLLLFFGNDFTHSQA